MFAFFLFIYVFTILLCFSTYAIYPFLIWLYGKLFPIHINKKEIFPSISILIAAYNEEKNLDRKLQNTLALVYPKDKVEILVGSDGSTDNTAAIAAKFEDRGVRVFDFSENRGKTAVQNDLVKPSTGEILLFTDASSFLPPDAIQKLIPNFADDRVGCVAGRMRFIDTGSNINTESQGLYWRYEIKIREMESKVGSLIGVDGPLYAIKREYYVPLNHNIISDFISPLLVLKQGKKVILEPSAFVDEEPTQKTIHEFKTRRRITLRGLIGLFSYPELLNLLSSPLLAWQVFFHKVLRWFVGPLIIINFLSCLALLDHWFFKLFLILYFLFFLSAGFGWIADQAGKKVRALRIPYYFSLVNFAATMGVIDFFRKKQAVTWKPVRD